MDIHFVYNTYLIECLRLLAFDWEKNAQSVALLCASAVF